MSALVPRRTWNLKTTRSLGCRGSLRLQVHGHSVPRMWVSKPPGCISKAETHAPSPVRWWNCSVLRANKASFHMQREEHPENGDVWQDLRTNLLKLTTDISRKESFPWLCRVFHHLSVLHPDVTTTKQNRRKGPYHDERADGDVAVSFGTVRPPKGTVKSSRWG